MEAKNARKSQILGLFVALIAIAFTWWKVEGYKRKVDALELELIETRARVDSLRLIDMRAETMRLRGELKQIKKRINEQVKIDVNHIGDDSLRRLLTGPAEALRRLFDTARGGDTASRAGAIGRMPRRPPKVDRVKRAHVTSP